MPPPTLPEQTMDPLLIDTQPDSVAAWLERLPFTDLPECGRLLSQSMQNLSRVPLDSHLRHKLLKLYLKAVDRYYPLLENEIRQHDSLGTPKVRQLALLSVELFALIFITFKQTLHDRLAKRGLLDREHPKIELMAYTMMAARQLLSISQQCYSPITPDFWYDCHQLHVFASGHGWQDKGLANDDSIHTIYLQILLMGLTPSNRLAPTEQALSRQLIFDLAAKAQLIPVEALTQPVHGYLVDQQIDSPPRFLPISASKLGPGCFLLDLEPLRDILEKSREALQKAQNNHQQGLMVDELQLLSLLVEEWHQPKRRRHPRLKTQTIIEIVAALPGIWFHRNNLSWQLPGISTEEDTPRHRPPPPPCLLAISNQSDTGLLLHGQPRDQSLRAGELLLVTPPNQPENAKLGIARWVALRSDGREIECGVEFIGGPPQPALAMPSITHPGDHFQFALLLATPAGMPRLLLMAGRPYSQLREFRLHDGEGESLIRVSRLHTQTPLFQIMEYRDSEHF